MVFWYESEPCKFMLYINSTNKILQTVHFVKYCYTIIPSCDLRVRQMLWAASAKFRAFSNGILIRFNSFFSDFLGPTSICRPLTIEVPCHTSQAWHFGLIPTFNGTPSTSGKEHPVNSGGYYPTPDASTEKSSDTSAAQYTPSRTASEKGKKQLLFSLASRFLSRPS